jgi:hypothetical protein
MRFMVLFHELIRSDLDVTAERIDPIRPHLVCKESGLVVLHLLHCVVTA